MYTIYEKPNCGYCVRAKKLLQDNGLEYETISAVEQRETLIKRVKSSTGVPPKTVPQIYLGDKYIGGYTELCTHLRNTT